jgi:hypothetical protein
MTMNRVLLVLTLAIFSACNHAPPTLSPAGQRAYSADQGVVALGTIQHAAIELNKLQVCAEPGNCHALLSEPNTHVVVDAVTDALNSIKAAPQGWKPVATSAVDRIVARLDAAGKQQLVAYIDAARKIIASFTQETP